MKANNELQITDEQHTIIYAGNEVRFFVENNNGKACSKCFFGGYPVELCASIPCDSFTRKDGCNGYYSSTNNI